MNTLKIGVLVGSLRKESYNLKLFQLIQRISPGSIQFEKIEIGDLPLYNEDLDIAEATPESYVRFRKEITQKNGILFITPEYNRSVPAVLKNAIDVGSRPYGMNAWDKKPVAIISSSIGAIGGFGANHHLRQSLTFVNTPCMQQPECYLSNIDALLKNESALSEYLFGFLSKFEKWVKRFN